ncbi:MAG: stage II sporulation protein P [Firmicutes bacterium]|nr:stage II sporulation protein P [Bacillota bacterium]
MPDHLNQNSRSANNWFIYTCLGVFMMTLGVLLVLLTRPENENLICSTVSGFRNRVIRLDTQTSRFLLKSGLPVLEYIAGEDDPFTLSNLNWPEFYWKLAANIKNASPQELLKNQLPILSLVSPRPFPLNRVIIPRSQVLDQLKVQTLEKLPEGTVVAEENQMMETQPVDMPPLGEQPVVLIYHTHNSESFLPVGGKEHIYPQGDIVKFGSYLQEILEDKYGVRCLHNMTVHDHIPFRESYIRARKTLQSVLKEYAGLKVVLDLHRDATPGVKARAVINGLDTATIGIVVGSDKMKLEHPHWRKNLQFANELAEAMNLYYPGLNSRVIVSEARYNQDLHDHALILELGDQNSTLEELNRAVELFAGVLAVKIKEEAEKNKG